MEQKVVILTEMMEALKVDAKIQAQVAKKSAMYAGDFKRFPKYTQQAGVAVSFAGLKSYLVHTIEQGLKLNTFNRCSASVKHFLVHEHGLVETDEQKQRIAIFTSNIQ